jgi:hypothetical protein
MINRRLFSASVLGLLSGAGLLAQAPKLDLPAASPAATLTQRVGLTNISITYSRPSLRGRKMLGVQNPYGEVWRTGANASTKISFSTPVMLNGAAVPAGTYALYTIPDPSVWTVIIDKDTSLWGAYNYKAQDDLVRFQATAVALTDPVETFTIEYSDLRDESATLNLIWEKTRVPIKIEVSVVEPVKAQIAAAMAGTGKKPYAPAAQFYLEHNLDLPQALAWANAAVAEKTGYSVLYLKARILAKMGDKDGALAAAHQSLELAAKAEGPVRGEYTRLNQDLIATLR